MLARLRTMLDEVSEIFYDDDLELYPALSLAQLEMVKIIADAWRLRILKGEEPVKMPVAIMPLRSSETATVETIGQKGDILSAPAIQAVSCLWNPDARRRIDFSRRDLAAPEEGEGEAYRTRWTGQNILIACW